MLELLLQLMLLLLYSYCYCAALFLLLLFPYFLKSLINLSGSRTMAAGSIDFQCLYKVGKPLHMLRSSMAKCRSNPPYMIYSMTIVSIKETFACC